MAQVFVVVAAGSVLSFIIRELGDPAIASWVIQVRLLLALIKITDLQITGTPPYAIGLITPGWSIVRCLG